MRILVAAPQEFVKAKQITNTRQERPHKRTHKPTERPTAQRPRIHIQHVANRRQFFTVSLY